MLDSSWISDMNQATKVITDTAHLGQVGAQYIKALDRYVMLNWYYPDLNNGPQPCIWKVYESSTPWGPWTYVATRSWSQSEGAPYNPNINPKYISADGKTMTLLCGGYFWSDSTYRLHAVTMYLNGAGPTPSPTPYEYTWANDDAAGMQYGGGWTDDNNRPQEYNGDLHYTSMDGNYAQYTFTGTGVDWINEKASDLGNVDVYIDGSFDRTVNIYSAARVHQQTVYQKSALAYGGHTIKLVKKDAAYMSFDALKIYTSTATATPTPTPTPMPVSFTWANDDATGMQYSAGWTDDNNRPQEYNSDLHYTTGNGNYVQYTFTGSGVDWINEKAYDLGNVDVYIDGNLDSTVNIYSATRVHQQTIYSKRGLAGGSHTIKLVKKDAAYMSFDALKIYP